MPKTNAGGAPLGALFWIAGLALLFLPFARPRAARGPEDGDPVRAASPTDRPFEADVARFEQELGLPLRERLSSEAEARFGSGSPLQAEGVLLHPARLRAGAEAYGRHCVGCHGSTGDGAGPAARHLSPRPRDLRRGIFKFTSTAAGDRPLPEDLLDTITRGLAGSSMPDFRLLPEETRRDLVEYVRYVALRGEFEHLALDLAWEEEELPDFDEVQEIVVGRWEPSALRQSYPAVPEPPTDADSVVRGLALFRDGGVANCAACHGNAGQGDGPSAGEFLDGWGYPIRPRDLTSGIYRAGATPAALYHSIAHGINGTPMPAFQDSLTPEQIWDLVHSVQGLRR
jgi:mono/diheme cytochrome c family protein